jgi:hypothetical protein
MDIRAVAETTEYYPLSTYRVNLRDGTGYIASQEERELRAYTQQRNSWTDAISWTAYRSASSTLTDNLETFPFVAVVSLL